MSESRNVEALRWLYDNFARGNFWAGKEVFDPEIEWEWSPTMAGAAGRARYHGLAGVEAATRDWLDAFEWFWMEAEDFIESGDRVLVHVRRRARAKASEFEVETRAADLWTMRDGKALSYLAYDDRGEAMEALRKELG